MAVVREAVARRRQERERRGPEAEAEGVRRPPATREDFLLNMQRSAGNAAVLQLLGRDGAPAGGTAMLQRRQGGEPAEATPANAPAPPAGAPAAGAGTAGPRRHATDWFVDYDQMKRGGGKAGERGASDVLWVRSLIVGQGSDIRQLKGFNAAASGPAHVGTVQHAAGAGHVSGNIDYVSSADVKVGTTLSNASKAKGMAARQRQVADAAARDYVTRRFHLQQGDEAALEHGAREAADAALAKDAEAAAGESAEPPAAPTSAVDIKVVARTKGQPSLPTVNYEIGADSDCFVYVVIPSKEYKATVSKTTVEGDQHYHRREGSSKEKERSGGSVDVSQGGSTTTQQSQDWRLKQVIERKQRYARSFVRNTHTAISRSLETTFHQIITLLIQTTSSSTETKTSTPARVPETTIDVEDEGQLRQEKPSIWDRAFDAIKSKLGGLIKDKIWSYADKLIGRRYPLYRLIPKSVKDWAKRTVTDLVWKGGSWLWRKITGGEAEVKHTPEEKDTLPDPKQESRRRTESSITYQDAKDVSSKAAMSFSSEVSEQVRAMFQTELNVKVDVNVGGSSSKGTTTTGKVDVHGEGGKEKELGSGEVEEDSSQRGETKTYTTDLVRIETGKPVMELTIKPK